MKATAGATALMLRRRGRMKDKTVFIFGAGASKADGLPTQAELLKEYFLADFTDDYSTLLRGYFRDFFGIKDNDIRDPGTKWPTFEEALAMVEIAMDKEQSFGATYTTTQLHKIKEGLVISMGRAIESCPTKPKTIHKRFIGKLFRMGHYREQEYAFVSFNYDILLDNALMELLDKKIYCDYGLTFANASPDYISDAFPRWVPPGGKRVLILKPHGSLNWVQCPACDSLAILGDSKSQIFKTGVIHTVESCPRDNAAMQFVIEPPSYFKKYKNYNLQTVWKRFHNVLAASTKIVFIGYSMPDADVMIKYAIKQACFGRDRRIIVIDPDERVRDQYARVLGNIEFHKMGFEELVLPKNYAKIR